MKRTFVIPQITLGIPRQVAQSSSIFAYIAGPTAVMWISTIKNGEFHHSTWEYKRIYNLNYVFLRKLHGTIMGIDGDLKIAN